VPVGDFAERNWKKRSRSADFEAHRNARCSAWQPLFQSPRLHASERQPASFRFYPIISQLRFSKPQNYCCASIRQNSETCLTAVVFNQQYFLDEGLQSIERSKILEAKCRDVRFFQCNDSFHLFNIACDNNFPKASILLRQRLWEET
jgi:hypothetical protein